MARIWDISQRLHPATPVWPGDVGVSEKPTWGMEDGSPVNVAAVRFSTHTGTHADAPLHYVGDGMPIAEVDLSPYLGPCLLVDGRGQGGQGGQSGKGDRVLWEDIKEAVEVGMPATRVLIRTFDTFPEKNWPTSYRAMDETLIDELGARGCVLIGTDAPSLDPQTSKEMKAHKAVARHGLAILEGLVFDAVDFGSYELIALPLPFQNLDASPVRAILRR